MMTAGEALAAGRSAGGVKYSAGLDHAREQLSQAVVGLEVMLERADN